MTRVFISLLLILSSLGIYAQGQTSEQIRSIMQEQTQAWNDGNIEGFMEAYWKSDSLLFIGSAGPQYGWQTTLDKYKSSYPDKAAMGELVFDILTIEVIDAENAHVSGKWTLNRESDMLFGYYSLLWKKINGNWVIVYDHSSIGKKKE